MREAIEARLPSIRTLARIADASEREGRKGAMHVAVVNGCTAGADFAQAALGFGFGTEGVETEWGGVDDVCDADCLVEVVDGKNGHERAEGFVDEEAVFWRVDLD